VSEKTGLLRAALLLEKRVDLDDEVFRARVRERCGPFDLGFVAVSPPSDGPAPASSVDPAVEQTWSWPGARAAVDRHRSSILVSELKPGSDDRAERLERWNGVLRALIELTPCMALQWMSSQKLVDPKDWLQALDGPDATPLLGALNVRLFNVMERVKGELVMDTLGLEVFDLPDLQLHFVGLEPSAVAALLYGCAAYVFEQGDVIEDGHTVQGLEPDQRWRAQHEVSLVGPERAVIDFDPGAPFAAGERPKAAPKKRAPSTRAARARRLGRKRRREP
jgi:hypothetical protein